MIKLLKHPDGPAIDGKRFWFRTYVELANYAEKQLLDGLYFVRNANAAKLDAIREAKKNDTSFYVEGRGAI